MHQKTSAGRAPPGTLGKLKCSSDPLAVLVGGKGNGQEGGMEERKGYGSKGREEMMGGEGVLLLKASHSNISYLLVATFRECCSVD